jgi:serine/threonine protein kinase
MVAKILKGLEAVHRAGYVHADIKPTNLLFDSGSIMD